MATFSQKDISLLYVGAAATKTTGDIDGMNDGEIGIFTPAGTRITEATAATEDEFIVVKKTANGGIPLVSGVINKNDISSCTLATYTAATDKVVNIGYDGTSGSIDATNDNDYHVRINMREGRTSNHGGLYVKHGYYKSDASATQEEIASNLHISLVAEFSKEPTQKVLTEILCDEAGAAITGTTTILGVINGSRYAALDGTITNVVAGDYVRIGGTATTDPVYKVEEVTSGSSIKLEVPYQGATSTSLAIANVEVITAAQAAAAEFGIQLTAVEPNTVVGKLHGDLDPVNFDVTLTGFGTTPNVVGTASTPGIGTEKQVAELEWFCQGNEGDFYRIGEPNLFASRTEVSGNYDLITLVTKENYQGSIVSGPINKSLILAIPETAPNYAVTGTTDDITDVLEVLAFGSANGNLAVS